MGGKIFKTIPVETYRGVVHINVHFVTLQCTILRLSKKKNDFLRRKTIENVRKELLDLKKLYSPEFIYFVDDSFLARPKRNFWSFVKCMRSLKYLLV